MKEVRIPTLILLTAGTEVPETLTGLPSAQTNGGRGERH